MDKQFSCCFTGHRPIKLPWKYDESDPRCIALKQKIYDAAEALYFSGIRHYICGMAMGCDMYFGEAVLELKKAYPDITLEAAIPCASQADSWTGSIKNRYNRIKSEADVVTVLEEKYSIGCMNRRNKYMVDNSSYVIAAYDGSSGGTMRTIDYAERKGLNIIHILP